MSEVFLILTQPIPSYIWYFYPVKWFFYNLYLVSLILQQLPYFATIIDYYCYKKVFDAGCGILANDMEINRYHTCAGI